MRARWLHMRCFNPLRAEDGYFRCFWSLDSGWGEFVLTPDLVEVTVHYGTLPLRRLRLPILADCKIGKVSLEGSDVEFSHSAGEIVLAEEALLSPHQRLNVTFRSTKWSTALNNRK